MLKQGIREVDLEWTPKGTVGKLRVVFGPHYFLEIESNKGETNFILGCTHHGFKARAVDLNDELERIIDVIKERHTDIVNVF